MTFRRRVRRPTSSRTRRRPAAAAVRRSLADRKSTRLNSSHLEISYAVFCLKKKKKSELPFSRHPPPPYHRHPLTRQREKRKDRCDQPGVFGNPHIPDIPLESRSCDGPGDTA